MTRRVHRQELEFGSDSFLDVVCNIVGILIILIVIVAVKVQRQPRESRATSIRPEVQAVPVLSDADTAVADRQQALQGLQQEANLADQQLQSLQDAGAQSLQQIQSAMESQALLRQDLAAETDRARQFERQAMESADQRRTIAARLAGLERDLRDQQNAQAQLEGSVTMAAATEQDLSRKIQGTLVETQRLQEVLGMLELKTQPRDRLEHRLSPVTKPVESGELHFRVSQGRVSEIPLEELLERLKAQVLSRRAAVMRFNHFEGTVGPVRGYLMEFTVEKQGPSTLEALRDGDMSTRVNVTRWMVQPDKTLADETIEQAVRKGSRYRQVIETAVPDTVVTMWIYPDSFDGFAALREVAHGLQLRVAARPLPEGTPIVGSPSGSKSNAQ